MGRKAVFNEAGAWDDWRGGVETAQQTWRSVLREVAAMSSVDGVGGGGGARNRNKQECGMIFCPEQSGGDAAEAEILIFPHASCFLPTEVGGQKASG